MRRRIYRHIREETLGNEFSTTALFWVTISYIILAIAWEVDFSIFMLPVFFFCWWLLRILRNIRDNYIMDKLSAKNQEKIFEILGPYDTLSSTKTPPKLKLQIRSKNDFLPFIRKYEPYLSSKRQIVHELPEGKVNWEDVLIHFPILEKNYYNFGVVWGGKMLEKIFEDKKIKMTFNLFSSIKITRYIKPHGIFPPPGTPTGEDIILIIEDVIPWRPCRKPIWWSYDIKKTFITTFQWLIYGISESIKNNSNQPSIYITRTEISPSSSSYKYDNGKYILITSNELCLFDVFTDKKEE